MNFSSLRSYLVCLCGTFAAAGSLQAATIYDNSVNDLGTRFNPGTSEVGDQIVLAGTERYLTNFSFEFWGTNMAGGSLYAGNVEARVRFYKNDGALFNGYASPGQLFYDSQWFSVGLPTSRSTMVFEVGQDFANGGLFLPVASDMTWTIQFQGMGATDQTGLDIYSPVTTGQNYPDYWQLVGGTWELMTNSVATDFAARFEASLTQVPEPSAAALGLMALTACALTGRRLFKRGT
jgi:hypothetical protein